MFNRYFKLYEPDGSDGGGDPKPEKEVFDREYVLQLREEAKQNRLKVKEFEDKLQAIDNEKSAKNGEFEKLMNQFKEKAEKAEAKAAKYEEIEAENQTLKQQRRDELIGRLPNDELKAVANKITDVSVLTEYVNTTLKLFPSKVHTDGGRSGTVPFDDSKVTSLKQLSYTQQEELKKGNPTRYQELWDITYPN
jgi:preprotein translocase subunit SecD